MNRRRNDMPSLHELLPRVLRRLAKDGDARTLHPVWSEVVGEQVAKNAKPDTLVDGTLEVAVTAPSWEHVLTRQAADILKRLQARLGDQSVQRLVFVVR